MAKTIQEWKRIMTDQFIGNEVIKTTYNLQPGKTFEDEFSTASVESILFYAVAFCAWLLETLFDLLRADTVAYIATMKPGTTRWYATKALMYQHGFSLLPDSDVYDNAGHTDQDVADSKVVAYAACVEEPTQGGRMRIRLKMAGDGGEDLQPLAEPVVEGVQAYFDRIKYAGVPIKVESKAADQLQMAWKVYYDPMILDATGSRLDGTGEKMVEARIKEYLKQIPFNGIYAVQKHEDYVQATEGVVLCPVQWAKHKYGDYGWMNIDTLIRPDAGYLRFADEADLEIEFIKKSAF
ncbi:MAG: hypothetical protein M9959_02175 [Chitinophagaceae bacterium]|nr:hypothetical protein [Chitinophagaceae bacterium]